MNLNRELNEMPSSFSIGLATYISKADDRSAAKADFVSAHVSALSEKSAGCYQAESSFGV